ncbi:MAG TPA: translation initiation factor IF-6 [Candidatus Thermoplasmatota archaeon]|nr:translation initiation factor IF-6 [Candidatus Thermoplasmatota archaeon]
MLFTLELAGSPHVGVFAKASDALVLVPTPTEPSAVRRIAESLATAPVPILVGGATIVGACVALNRRGAVVADFAEQEEIAKLRRAGLEVALLGGTWNAAGNNVLANDRGALVNADLDDASVREIERALGVPVARGTIAGHKTVGSAAAATNKGVLCHPKISEEEIVVVEETLKVPVEIGTINHGMPFIGAGVVANSHGAAIGKLTTGPEMNRLEDALGYL